MVSRASERITNSLEELGFKPLEAQIYVHLLQHSPATGYKIAKAIGRSFTSTYRALDSLFSKGAVLVEEGENRLARAVPIEDLMRQLQANFLRQQKSIVAAAQSMPISESDRRIYRLGSIDQLYTRFRLMLQECRKRALIELFPGPCSALAHDIEEAAARGIAVSARVYSKERLKGVHMVWSPFGKESLESIEGQWLSLFADGRQFLFGHLSGDCSELWDSVWSSNPFVARAFFSYANSDLHLYSFLPFLNEASSLEELRTSFDRIQEIFPVGGDLGFEVLRRTAMVDSKSPARRDLE